MLQGVHHAGVTVANLDRSPGFDRDVLGLEVFAGARSFYVRGHGYTVELLQPPPGR